MRPRFVRLRLTPHAFLSSCRRKRFREGSADSVKRAPSPEDLLLGVLVAVVGWFVIQAAVARASKREVSRASAEKAEDADADDWNVSPEDREEEPECMMGGGEEDAYAVYDDYDPDSDDYDMLSAPLLPPAEPTVIRKQIACLRSRAARGDSLAGRYAAVAQELSEEVAQVEVDEVDECPLALPDELRSRRMRGWSDASIATCDRSSQQSESPVTSHHSTWLWPHEEVTNTPNARARSAE
jgi:hypothetical protein